MRYNVNEFEMTSKAKRKQKKNDPWLERLAQDHVIGRKRGQTIWKMNEKLFKKSLKW